MTLAYEARLIWEGGGAAHCDRLLLPPSALQADGGLLQAGRRLETETVVALHAEHWIQPPGEAPRRLPMQAFRLHPPALPGRFYPRLAFAGLAAGPRDLRPCRLLQAGEGELTVDLNDPLADRAVQLHLLPRDQQAARTRFVQLFDGPGMQVPPADAALCYLGADALARQDEAADDCFYAEPRLVHHLDAACRAEIAALHGRFLAPGQRVLDLMSSWTTHLPAALPAVDITGLGMNRDELAANHRLAARLVHDLNQAPRLPFADASFDLVLCAASVEYLVHPRAVFAEVRRVLKPGGAWVVSFSDRWFPPKAIQVWRQLHPFERLGMVLWLMRQAGFTAVHTETLRGLRRPEDDKYAQQRDYSDPLFAVWGYAP